jgi:hypothetical protein
MNGREIEKKTYICREFNWQQLYGLQSFSLPCNNCGFLFSIIFFSDIFLKFLIIKAAKISAAAERKVLLKYLVRDWGKNA